MGRRDEVDRLIARARADAHERPGRAAANLARDEEDDLSEDEESISCDYNARRPGDASRGRATEDKSRRSVSEGPGTDEDVRSMSGPGQGWTDADYRTVARYIASRDPEEWQATSKVARWTEFAQQVSDRIRGVVAIRLVDSLPAPASTAKRQGLGAKLLDSPGGYVPSTPCMNVRERVAHHRVQRSTSWCHDTKRNIRSVRVLRRLRGETAEMRVPVCSRCTSPWGASVVDTNLRSSTSMMISATPL